MDTDRMVFFVTVPNQEVALKIGRTLVEEKVVACANIIPGLTSIYHWQGKIEEDSELLIILKTTKDRTNQLLERLPALHPYDTPECIGFPIGVGLQKYLDWIQTSIM